MELIGRKIKGFKFSGQVKDSIYYSPDMNNFIGIEGTIVGTGRLSIVVEFNNGIRWSYPILEALSHLIDEYPKVMEVSNDKVLWDKRVVFMEKGGYFYAWENAETLEESEEVTDVTKWNYAREVQEEPISVTREEIARAMNIPLHLLRITDR